YTTLFRSIGHPQQDNVPGIDIGAKANDIFDGFVRAGRRPFIADNAPPVVAVKGISEFGPDPDNRICSRKVVGQKARIVAVCQIKSELKNRLLVSSDIKNSGIIRSLDPRHKITGAGIPGGVIKRSEEHTSELQSR